MARTMEIAERCNFKLQPVENPFPEFAVPQGHTIDSYFEQVCREGYKKRLETAIRHLEIARAAAHADRTSMKRGWSARSASSSR